MNEHNEQSQGSQNAEESPAVSTGVPHPLAQTLHDRAGESARETRQAVITLSAGSLGFFFLALTSKADPALSSGQVDAVIVALVSMALAVFSGLWSAWSDARWSYCWARQVENHEPGAEYWERHRVFWHCHKRWSEHAALLVFGIGVLAAVVYTYLRASNS